MSRFVVDPETNCWLWTGSISTKGYGALSHSYVHRRVHAALVGPIPEGYEVDHLCNVRHCGNPAHLEAVTRQENMRRIKVRNKTCRRGHEWTADNTYVRRDTGRRACKTCQRLRTKGSRDTASAETMVSGSKA